MTNHRIKLNSRSIFRGLFVLLMAALFAGYVFRISFTPVILLGLTVAMVCIGGRDEILAVLLLCIPLETAFGYSYTIVIGMAVWMVRYRHEIRINLTVVPIVLIVLWEMLHCLGKDVSLPWLVGMTLPYLFCGLLMWQDAGKVDYGFVVRCLAVCISVMCVTLLAVLLIRSGFSLTAAFANMQRLGVRSEDSGDAVLQINPNTLGVICVLSITTLLQLITAGRGTRMDLFMVLLMLICGGLTTSKTYLALVAIMAVLFWMGRKGGFWEKLRSLLLLLGVIILAAAVLYAVFPAVVENYLIRFNVQDLSSGRASLFMKYHRFLMSRPEVLGLGVGVADFKGTVLTKYAVALNVPHNGLQELIVAWGIPGGILFLAFLVSMLRRGRRTAPCQTLVNYIPLLILAAKVQVGQMLTSGYTMLAFALVYLSLCQDFREQPRQ